MGYGHLFEKDEAEISLSVYTILLVYHYCHDSYRLTAMFSIDIYDHFGNSLSYIKEN